MQAKFWLAEDSVSFPRSSVHFLCVTFHAGQICGAAVGNIVAVSVDGTFSNIGSGVSGGYILAMASTGYEM
jgi:hypothetical protein